MTQRIYGIRATEEDVEALDRVLQTTGLDKTTWMRQVIHRYDQVLADAINGNREESLPELRPDAELRIRRVLALIMAHASQADPQWLLDQIVRHLTDGDEYEGWVVEYNRSRPYRWQAGSGPAVGD